MHPNYMRNLVKFLENRTCTLSMQARVMWDAELPEGLFDLLAGYLSELEETGAIRSFDVGGELGGKHPWIEFSFDLVRTKKELCNPNLAFDRARAIVRSATKKLIRICKVPRPKRPIRIAWQGTNEIAA